MATFVNPAQILQGEILETGWEVEEQIQKHPDGTGGHFSINYSVRNIQTGQRAFLKALNFEKAFEDTDTARALGRFLAAYNFERDVLVKCRTSRMRRVVTPICDGVHKVDGCEGLWTSVHYLIFERASGDLRAFRAAMSAFDMAWCMRSMHHAAIGVSELHCNGIAHQDLKPSNVLTFEQQGSKLADLGRSFDIDTRAPHDTAPFAGDRTYAPPEAMYGHLHHAKLEERRAADLYALGNLLFFHFLDVSATEFMLSKVRDRTVPIGGRNFADDLVGWKRLFSLAMEAFADAVHKTGATIADDVVQVASELCYPDPGERGDPVSRRFKHQSNYTAIRYVTRFDRLARRARIFGA